MVQLLVKKSVPLVWRLQVTVEVETKARSCFGLMFVWLRLKVLWVVKCWGVDLAILTGVCVEGPCSKSKTLPQGKQKRCAGHATRFIIRMMGAMSTLHIGSSAWIVFHPNKIFAYNWEVRNWNMSWKDLLKCKGWRSFKSYFCIWFIHSFTISWVAVTSYCVDYWGYREK